MPKIRGIPPLFVTYGDYSLIPDSIGPMRSKYEEIERRIREEGIASGEEIVRAEMADYRDLLLAHDRSYVDELMNLKNTPRLIFSGLPLNEHIRDLFLLNTGITVRALELAIENGIAMAIGGGSVHAQSAQAAAFCLINDVAVALLRAKVTGRIQRGAFIHCNHNQADGTTAILKDDPSMVGLSMHETESYPFVKQENDHDVPLGPGTGDAEYLALLEESVFRFLDGSKPDAVIYIAGSAAYEGDSSSKLSLSLDGLKRRDEFVIGASRERGIAVAVLTSASFDPGDRHSVGIHLSTARIVKEAARRWPR
jgi:acetoin utilization deacetylase AcuC-like enzyme